VFNMLATSVLSFIVATIAASNLASPLSSADADVKDVESVSPSADSADIGLANLYCN
jgi:hypothetical protein